MARDREVREQIQAQIAELRQQIAALQAEVAKLKQVKK